MKLRMGFWVGLVLAALLGTVTMEAQLTGPVVHGIIRLDGSNPSSGVTGLKTLNACVISVNSATIPSSTSSVFTVQYTPTSGRLDIYAWKPTSTSVTTLVASTAAGDQIVYICTGTTN